MVTSDEPDIDGFQADILGTVNRHCYFSFPFSIQTLHHAKVRTLGVWSYRGW